MSATKRYFKSADTLWHQIRLRRLGRRPVNIPKAFPKPIKDEPEIAGRRTTNAESVVPPELAELRFAFPEFLPSPVLEFRDKVKDKLLRTDMIRRRTVIEIPEFYVGSIIAVTISDPYAPGKCSKFVGICIERAGQGTEANFTLRNRVDGQGVEIRYDLYNPTIREIQVLRLEKRLDPHLLYLRDALPEYSVFPFDMTPEPLTPGQPVPVNPIRVVMKKWPWTRNWEYDFDELKGIAQLPDMPDFLYVNKWRVKNYTQQYDLMQEYRSHIPEEEQIEIWQEVKKHKESITEQRNIERRKKLLQQTVKSK